MISSDNYIVISDIEGTIRLLDNTFVIVKQFPAFLLGCQMMAYASKRSLSSSLATTHAHSTWSSLQLQ